MPDPPLPHLGTIGPLLMHGLMTVDADALRFTPHRFATGEVADDPPWELRRGDAAPLRLVRGIVVNRLFQWNERYQRWDRLFGESFGRRWIRELSAAGWEFEVCWAHQWRRRRRPPRA